jgi:hypothetical protein
MTGSIGLLDRLACLVGIWALKRLYGECSTDVHDDFPGDPDVRCIGCDATKLIHNMRELQQ